MGKFLISANKSHCDWILWRLIGVTFSGLACSFVLHKVEIVSGMPNGGGEDGDFSHLSFAVAINYNNQSPNC
jgi:hypothetical protein